PRPAHDERRRKTGNAPVPERRSVSVVEDRIRQAVYAHKPARIAGIVVRVDADDDQALRPVPGPRSLEQGRLVTAGPAPRRPEVDRHDLAAKRGERKRAGGIETREAQRRRRDGLAAVDLDASLAGRDPPHEDPSEDEHDDDRDCLGCALEVAKGHYSTTTPRR